MVQSLVVLTGRPDPLQVLIELYPEIEGELHRTIHKLRLKNVNNRNFTNYKERIYIVQNLRHQLPNVEIEKKELLNVILHENFEHAKDAIKELGKIVTSHEESEQPRLLRKTWNVVNSYMSPGSDSEFVDRTIKDAKASASSVSDAQFLAELNDIEELPVMKKVVAETRVAALDHFKPLVTRHATSLAHHVLQIQIRQCLAKVHREAVSDEEQQQAELRKKFIAEINDHSRAAHHS